MDKVSFYREFHVALAMIGFLLYCAICVAQEMVEYYEHEQYPGGIRYSKFLVALRIFTVVQSFFALEEVISTFSSSQMDLDRIPEPDLLRLLEHFVSKFSERSLSVISAVCSYMYFGELLRGRDGVGRDGMPFLMVLVAIFIFRFFLIFKT
ncbi:hypothetical protein F511_40787 [Dorcoceras hygrometricum]|uniref:Uncharacterized protein n=1 Tax=Dorcoceras hygrometricum TaxID=472368 RepID=A0A2Z7CQ96_9LAMI|nr:hypothetical protein F511_40787 [Dorcoceras hygrometricum]